MRIQHVTLAVFLWCSHTGAVQAETVHVVDGDTLDVDGIRTGCMELMRQKQRNPVIPRTEKYGSAARRQFPSSNSWSYSHNLSIATIAALMNSGA
jgi:hypothetical protein